MVIVPIKMSRLRRILTIFCLFVLTVKVEGEEDLEEWPPAEFDHEELGLAEEAFDDQYLGCRQAMEHQIEAQGILKAEMSTNKNFQRAWKEAERIWSMKIKDSVGTNLPQGFGDLHGVALVAYTGFIRDHFNKAVRSAGKSYRAYVDHFHFKFLHFYLTVALQLLYQDCKGDLQTTYQGYEDVLYWLPSGTTKVKFGHFLHTSSNWSVAYENGNASFFTVLGCSGVPVDKFSEYPHEEEVVFPGYEVFTVREVQRDVNEFHLTSTGRWCSNFNCAFIQGERSRTSVDGCVTSGGNTTWSNRGAWLRNMSEVIFSAAPPGPAFLTSLMAAVVAFFL